MLSKLLSKNAEIIKSKLYRFLSVESIKKKLTFNGNLYVNFEVTTMTV